MTPDHISATQLAMYLGCGAQYEFRYIQGLKIPPKGAQIRGTGVHQARAKNLAQKVESRIDLPVDEIVEVARDSVSNQFAVGEVGIEAGESPKAVRAETIDAAVRLTRCDALEFQAKMQPTAVEAEITVTVPGLGRDILGYLDTADDEKAVRDLKAMSKSPAAGAADNSDQLSTYALLYKTKFGELPSRVQLDAVVDLAKGPKAVAVVSVRTAEDLDMILRRYYAAIKAIDKGVFVPCPSDFWKCSPKWCGYYGVCQYARRGDSRPTE